MRVWAVTFTEAYQEESILVERDEAGNWVHMVFADSAYDQAVAKFNEYRDERLSFHKVEVEGTFGPDAHAHLVAREYNSHAECCDEPEDTVQLRPYEVIGG